MLMPPDCALGVWPGFDFGGLPLGLPLGGGADTAREIFGRAFSAGSEIVLGLGVLVRDGTTILEFSVEEATGSLSFGGMLKGTRGLFVDATIAAGLTFSGILAGGKEGGVSETGVLGM